MPRPFCLRHIGCPPSVRAFKPVGVPLYALETVMLTLDELEALRLADWEGLYQEEAAQKMNISRPTFARIVEGARRKTADALIHGKAIRMEGGPVIMQGEVNMSNRDAMGPRVSELGQGRGPCGCGQRHGWTGRKGCKSVLGHRVGRRRAQEVSGANAPKEPGDAKPAADAQNS